MLWKWAAELAEKLKAALASRRRPALPARQPVPAAPPPEDRMSGEHVTALGDRASTGASTGASASAAAGASTSRASVPDTHAPVVTDADQTAKP
jgi:hypothetical protein